MSILSFKKKNTLAFILTAAIVVSGFSVYKSNAAGRVDLTKDVKITAVVDSNSDTSEFAKEYVGEVKIELYKIADLDAAGNPTLSEEFKTSDVDLSVLGPNTTVEDTKTKIVNPAVDFVKEHDNLTKITIDGKKTEAGMEASATIKNGAGIYLYYVSKTVQDTKNEYIFTPAVFYAPSSEYVLSGTGKDEWEYEVKIAPKAKAQRRYGDLEIKKTLNTFNKSLGTASFVFEVEGTDETGKTVFSNVYTMNFDGATTESIKVEHIPSQTVCKVTEVYSGASYSNIAVPVNETETIIADDTVTAEFVNDYDDRLEVGGAGIENHFEKKESNAGENATVNYTWTGNNISNGTTEGSN